MIDHVGFGISSFDTSKAFYLAALKPLGFAVVAEGPDWALVGNGGAGRLWFGRHSDVAKPIHLAFAAASRHAVDLFYQAAIAAGGRDNGEPGIRADYHPDYYAAFVLDPDGHNIEAVCHVPDEGA